VKRLKEFGVTTCHWPIWHTPTDRDDRKLSLPTAAQAGIEVWAYLGPPSGSPLKWASHSSEPLRPAYQRWAEEIVKLSLQHGTVTGCVIDDFHANRAFLIPAYLRECRPDRRALTRFQLSCL
jgi:hypothetical protein